MSWRSNRLGRKNPTRQEIVNADISTPLGIGSGLLGRLPQFDVRSRGFQVRPAIAAAQARGLKHTPWRPGKQTLDQGNDGACVGYSLTHRLNASPVRKVQHDGAYALAVYKSAQRVDPWPGEDYDGTSVLAGCKALKAMGTIQEYRWCGAGSGDVLADVVDALGYLGPVVVGINWYNSMFRPVDGLVRVDRASGVAGGHAICILAQRSMPVSGFEKKQEVVIFQNSWGPVWGVKWYGLGGHAMMLKTDLQMLLEESGEAVVPLETESA